MSQPPTVIGNNRHDTTAKLTIKPNTKAKTRSRNGCAQCKAKRLKCDETKPECLMCVKNGRKCPGYSQSFRWSTKHEKSLAAKAKGPSNLKDLITTTSKTINRDNQDDGSILKPNQVTEEPVINLESSLTSPPVPDASCPNPDTLPIGPNGHGALTPILDHSMLPDYEYMYGIELLQELLEEEPLPVYGSSPPMDASNSDPLFGDQVSFLTPISRGRSPFFMEGNSTYFSPPSMTMFPQIPQTINDRSSLLVEEWFRHVCSMWSSYDSEVNLNRKLALETWTRSEAVMNCLQSMSATCLSSQMPQMRQVAISSLKNAIKAIHRDLKSANKSPTLGSGSFPKELLLSLCCVGTAACWIDTKAIGGQFLREAKALIQRINRESDSLSTQDRQTLTFFNKSLIYWNMLVAVVSDDNEDLGVSKLEESKEGELSGPIVPHPWTGISATAQRLFAQAIRLCRRFRRHLKMSSISTKRSLQTAIDAITEAQHIEEELLGLEHYHLHEISETGDEMTPRQHFVDVAEGYRLASLLQLYQTFPDLVARRLPEDATEAAGVPWDRWIVPLSIRLVNTLKTIPPTSGTRCIQPLLYICASTGLRFDIETLTQQQAHLQQQQQQQQQLQQKEHHCQQQQPVPVDDSLKDATEIPLLADMDMDLSLLLDGADAVDDPPVSLTRLSIEVSHARLFIMERLSSLEHSLPPAPVLVAKELVRAIWAAYDSERPGTNYTHWIDVMEDSNLRTIFG